MTAAEVGDFAKLLQDAPGYAFVLIILVFLVLVWVNQGFSRLVEPVYFGRNRRCELLDAYLAAHGNDGTAPEMLAAAFFFTIRSSLPYMAARKIRKELASTAAWP